MYIVKVGDGEAVNLAGVAGDLASIDTPPASTGPDGSSAASTTASSPTSWASRRR